MQHDTEIYQALIEHMARNSEFQVDLSRDIGRITEKLDAVHAEARKTNGRVTSLEQFRWKLGGAMMLAVAIAEWAKAKFFGS
jgi:hypothetical protein